MCQLTISDIGRTNNHSEAAHRRLKRELDVVHSSVWKFIDGLRRVQKGKYNTFVMNLDQCSVKKGIYTS